MTTPLDDLLRTALHDLVDEAHPVDLGAAALVRGRQARRNRQAGIAAAAFALVGLAVAPIVLLPGRDPVLPNTPPSPSASPSAIARRPVLTQAPTDWAVAPLQLPGGWTVTSVAQLDPESTKGFVAGNPAYDTVVLNRSTRRYTVVGQGKYRSVWPAPTGDLVAVADGNGHTGKIGVLNTRTGDVRWTTASWILEPQWSPDGRRLLLTGLSRFTVLDAATGEATRWPVDDNTYLCTDLCQYVWLASGDEVALPITDRSKARSESAAHARSGVQVFSAATGKPVRTLPLKATPVTFSPDGTRALVQSENVGGGELRIADARTGAITGRIGFRDGWFGPDGRIIGWEPGRATLHSPTGEALETLSLPGVFADRTVTVGRRD